MAIIQCPKCKAILKHDATQCHKCGYALKPSTPTQEATITPAESVTNTPMRKPRTQDRLITIVAIVVAVIAIIVAIIALVASRNNDTATEQDSALYIEYEEFDEPTDANLDMGRYPYTSLRKLTHADVAYLSPRDLKIMRNEIFARHGYIFQTNDMKQYFSKQSWYRPTTTNVQLSSIEQYNVNFIKSYEH